MVVEDVVGGELVQLSQHAQAIVGLVHLQLYIYKKVVSIWPNMAVWEDPRLHLHMMEPV